MAKSGADILNDLFKVLGENPNSFALNIGLQRAQAIYDILNGKTQRISDRLIRKIIVAYPNIYRSYLLTGEGDVIHHGNKLPSPQKEQTFYKQLPTKQRAVEENMNIQKWVDPNHVPIPVYDLAGGASSITELMNDESILPTVVLLKGHLGCNVVVRHVDKAMNNDFPARCQLGIQKLKDYKKRIVPGMAAIVVLDELTVTRYVYHTDDDKFLLRSSDIERFPDMIIDKDEVLEMWKIKSLTPVPDIVLF